MVELVELAAGRADRAVAAFWQVVVTFEPVLVEDAVRRAATGAAELAFGSRLEIAGWHRQAAVGAHRLDRRYRTRR
jgi:hypothetical protein